MFRAVIKRLFEHFGYEIRKKVARPINQLSAGHRGFNLESATALKHNKSVGRRTFGTAPELHDLLIPIQQAEGRELSIAEISKQQGKWGFVQCLAGDQKFLMFLGGKDDGVALRFLHNGCYERKTMSLWVTACKEARIVLDVGAHTGSYTIAAKLSNPDATVVSFEPHHLNYSRLSLNLRANGLSADQTYMLAVSDSNRRTMFSVPKGTEYHSSGGYVGNGNGRDNYIVTCVALDDFIEEGCFEEIDVIKIDTEGHEINCLSGMKTIINKSIPTIFFECITRPDNKLEELLAKAGYEVFQINDSTGKVLPTHSIAPILDDLGQPLMSSINRIAIHPRRGHALVR
jgi:FkbM family methyltransferase